MIPASLNVDALLAAISAVAGRRLSLRSARTPAGKLLYLIFPCSAGELSHPFWRIVRDFSNQGLWDTPEQAVVGFAAELRNWAAQARAPAGRVADALLQRLLSNGPVASTEVQAEAVRTGISRDRLDRAARRVGVVRRKDGMRGGWIWELPNKPPFNQAAPTEELEGAV